MEIKCTNYIHVSMTEEEWAEIFNEISDIRTKYNIPIGAIELIHVTTLRNKVAQALDQWTN